MYYHRSNFQLIFQSCFQQEVDKVVTIVPNIVLGNMIENIFQYSAYYSNNVTALLKEGK